MNSGLPATIQILLGASYATQQLSARLKIQGSKELTSPCRQAKSSAGAVIHPGWVPPSGSRAEMNSGLPAARARSSHYLLSLCFAHTSLPPLLRLFQLPALGVPLLSQTAPKLRA